MRKLILASFISTVMAVPCVMANGLGSAATGGVGLPGSTVGARAGISGSAGTAVNTDSVTGRVDSAARTARQEARAAKVLAKAEAKAAKARTAETQQAAKMTTEDTAQSGKAAAATGIAQQAVVDKKGVTNGGVQGGADASGQSALTAGSAQGSFQAIGSGNASAHAEGAGLAVDADEVAKGDLKSELVGSSSGLASQLVKAPSGKSKKSTAGGRSEKQEESRQPRRQD